MKGNIEHIDKIFEQSSILSQLEMDQYLSGSMSAAQSNVFERKLAESPLNQDAFEGYKESQNNDESERHIRQIRNKIPYLIGGGGALIKMTWPYLAAGVAAIMGTVVLWNADEKLEVGYTKVAQIAVVHSEQLRPILKLHPLLFYSLQYARTPLLVRTMLTPLT